MTGVGKGSAGPGATTGTTGTTSGTAGVASSGTAGVAPSGTTGEASERLVDGVPYGPPAAAAIHWRRTAEPTAGRRVAATTRRGRSGRAGARPAKAAITISGDEQKETKG